MTKLIIHAGRAKTGSTAIQKFAAEQEDKLRDLGILYPRSGRLHGGHHPIAGALKEDPPRWLGVNASVEEYISAVRDEAKQSGMATVVVSSEAFQGTRIDRIGELLPGWEVSVLLFVRRQDRFFESLINQDVKVGILDRFPSFTKGFYAQVLNHLDEAASFGRQLGPERVRIALYDGDTDVVEEFLRAVGIENAGPGFEAGSGTRANTSLNSAALEAVLMVNRLFEKVPDRRALLHITRELGQREPWADKPQWWHRGFVLRPEERAAVVEAFRASNEELLDVFGATEAAGALLNVPDNRDLADVARSPATEAIEYLFAMTRSSQNLKDQFDRLWLAQSSEFPAERYRERVSALL